MVAREQLEAEPLIVLQGKLLAPAADDLTRVCCRGSKVVTARAAAIKERDSDRGSTSRDARGCSDPAVLVRAHSFVIDRGAAAHANIELDLRAGLPGLAVIGLGSRPARDLRERVQAAVLNSGFAFPRRRVTVNIAPPAPGGGAQLDVAVAYCVLAPNGEIDPLRIEGIGELRACGAGTMLADAAAAAGLAGLVLAEEDRDPALLAGALPVAGARTLVELVRLLRAPARSNERGSQRSRRELSEARGLPHGARRPG